MAIYPNIELQNLLYEIWETYFIDVPRKNLVIVKYGKFSKQRLGSIKWCNDLRGIKGIYKYFKDEHKIQDDKRITLIILTKYFTLEEIPSSVVKTTIAHELAHYAHGFHSPLLKLFKYPHQGNIIKKELYKRGLKEEFDFSEKWLKENWSKVVKTRRKTS